MLSTQHAIEMENQFATGMFEDEIERARFHAKIIQLHQMQDYTQMVDDDVDGNMEVENEKKRKRLFDDAHYEEYNHFHHLKRMRKQ